MSEKCKHEEWNPCGNNYYCCTKCGILRTSQQVNLYLEKDKQILNLQSKLAESETDNKALICDYESRITKHQELMSWLEHDNEQLKQQLEEKDKKALALFSALYDVLKEQDPENVSSRIDYLTKQNNGDISDFYKEHKVLKQQLDEKSTALKLCREYMFKVMCAEDVPSEEWFIECAKEENNRLLETIKAKDKEIEKQSEIIQETAITTYHKLMEKDIIFHLNKHKKELEEQVVKQEKELEYIQKQLEEKEEILEWQNEIIGGVKQEEELLAQKLKSLGVDCIEDLGKETNQDKISFALEQLERVKEFCDGIKLSMIYISQEDTTKIQTIIKEIDNQIEQLKKEMK